MKDLPMDGAGKVVAAGTELKSIYATINGLGVTKIETSSTDWKEIIIPAGNECNGFQIQVIAGNSGGFDPDDACLPFAWTSDLSGNPLDGPPIFCPAAGLGGSIAKSNGNKSLGFLKAPTGKDVVILLRQ
jgi:hypothetical protein